MATPTVGDGRTPLGTVSPARLNSDHGVGVDFSSVTASHFGISTDTLLTFSREKNKSRVTQLKAGRRSTIGLRGSPETNSLIRFRAKQAMMTPPGTPQHVLSSPLLSGYDSIKQKMAAFQRLMGADDENSAQGSSPMRSEESQDVGGSLPKDLQPDTELCVLEREGQLSSRICPPPATPPLSKRRRKLPPGLCKEEIGEEPLSDLPNTPKQEPEVGFSELQSLKLTQDLCSDSQSKLLSFPMLSQPETTRTDIAEVSSTSKKKRVRFGAPLSPEFFDKTLPPSTPLQRGATPACPTSTGPKRSVLKTPQRCGPLLPQPDFSSPESPGASPLLSGSSRGPVGPFSDDVFVVPQKIDFLTEDQFENPPADRKDSAQDVNEDVIPLAGDSSLLNAAFQEDEGPLGHSHLIHHPITSTEPETSAEVQQQEEEEAQLESASSTERPSRSRKRKCPAEPDPPQSRRSSRSAASAAKGKMKTATAKKRFGSKEVDRTLYGKRDYASKNPILSPIFEATASVLNGTPSHLHPGQLAANPDYSQTTSPSTPHGKACPSEVTANLLSAAALWRHRFISQASERDSESKPSNMVTCASVMDTPASESQVTIEPSDESHTGRAGSGVHRARRSRGRPATRRGSWNVSRAQTEEAVSEERTGKRQNSLGSLPESGAGGQVRREADNLSESPINPEVCPGEDGSHACSVRNARDFTEKVDLDEHRQPETKTPNRIKQARKRQHLKTTAVSEEDEAHRQTLDAEPSGDQREPEEKYEQGLTKPSEAVRQREITERSGDRGEVIQPVLESWQQADFSIEDILKPTARVRSSVRRSLRNRRSLDAQASGLAWVDRTSPDLNTASRRKTRGRLSAVVEYPPQLMDHTDQQPEQAE
ncbi:cell division cycle-associated protein 2 isoform X2 [Brachyhypopomus gauderio]|uniref:cell division cycle-associated protein 2 isoform X2 n=1 Tax=Brachyhypopomus gauderio TaxID=698409 RepID=UPI004041260D